MLKLFKKKDRSGNNEGTSRGFYQLTVSNIKQETPDTVSIALTIPNELATTFSYQQGQYLTLKVVVNGEECRRSYSLCSSPNTNEPHTIAVKRVAGGKVSNYLADEVKVGDTLEVMAPAGNFTSTLDASNNVQYVLFAAGSGITPVISILKSVLHTEPQSSVVLFYGNRNEESIIFNNELQALAQQHEARLQVIHTLSQPTDAWQGQRGRLDRIKAVDLYDKHAGTGAKKHFVCGPNDMMTEVLAALSGRGVAESDIIIEYFTTPVAEEKAPPTVANADADADDFTGISKVTILLDGEETEIEMQSKDFILNEAIESGLDAPYSCQGGVCTTCLAKVVEGKVTMDESFGITDDEIAKGYILTCQSHPKSATVKIDYNV